MGAGDTAGAHVGGGDRLGAVRQIAIGLGVTALTVYLRMRGGRTRWRVGSRKRSTACRAPVTDI